MKDEVRDLVVVFMFVDAITSKHREVRVRNIGDVIQGFWLNSNLEWTCGSDALFWVPPGQVLLARKPL